MKSCLVAFLIAGALAQMTLAEPEGNDAVAYVIAYRWNQYTSEYEPRGFEGCDGEAPPCGEIRDIDLTSPLLTYRLFPDTEIIKIIPVVANIRIPQLWFTSSSAPQQFSRVVIYLGDYGPLPEPTTAATILQPVYFGGIYRSRDPNTGLSIPTEFYGGARDGIGALDVVKLWRLDSGGYVGSIFADSTPSLGCVVTGWNLRANTNVEVRSGDLSLYLTGEAQWDSRIFANNGSIKTLSINGDSFAHVSAPMGKIENMSVGGQIMAPITANNPGPGIVAKSGIDSLIAARIQNTQIVANANGGVGNVGLLQLIGTAGSGTYATGSTTASSLNAIGAGSTFGVRTTGSVSARLAFAGDATQPMVINGGIDPSATINISGSLTANDEDDDAIVLPANGLKGQVIINSRNGLPANRALNNTETGAA